MTCTVTKYCVVTTYNPTDSSCKMYKRMLALTPRLADDADIHVFIAGKIGKSEKFQKKIMTSGVSFFLLKHTIW